MIIRHEQGRDALAPQRLPPLFMLHRRDRCNLYDYEYDGCSTTAAWRRTITGARSTLPGCCFAGVQPPCCRACELHPSPGRGCSYRRDYILLQRYSYSHEDGFDYPRCYLLLRHCRCFVVVRCGRCTCCSGVKVCCAETWRACRECICDMSMANEVCMPACHMSRDRMQAFRSAGGCRPRRPRPCGGAPTDRWRASPIPPPRHRAPLQGTCREGSPCASPR